MIGSIQRMVSCRSSKRQRNSWVSDSPAIDNLSPHPYRVMETAKPSTHGYDYQYGAAELEGCFQLPQLLGNSGALHEAPASTTCGEQSSTFPAGLKGSAQSEEGSLGNGLSQFQRIGKPPSTPDLPPLRTSFNSASPTRVTTSQSHLSPYDAVASTYGGHFNQQSAQTHSRAMSMLSNHSPQSAKTDSPMNTSSIGYAHSAGTPTLPMYFEYDASGVPTPSQYPSSASSPSRPAGCCSSVVTHGHSWECASTSPSRPQHLHTPRSFGHAEGSSTIQSQNTPLYHRANLAGSPHNIDFAHGPGGGNLLTDRAIETSFNDTCDLSESGLPPYTSLIDERHESSWQQSTYESGIGALAYQQVVQPSPWQDNRASADASVPRVLTCELCGEKFHGIYKKGNFGRHKRQKHSSGQHSPQEFPCGYCSKSYKRSDARKRHWWKIHRIGTKPTKRVKDFSKLLQCKRTSIESLPPSREAPNHEGRYA